MHESDDHHRLTEGLESFSVPPWSILLAAGFLFAFNRNAFMNQDLSLFSEMKRLKNHSPREHSEPRTACGSRCDWANSCLWYSVKLTFSNLAIFRTFRGHGLGASGVIASVPLSGEQWGRPAGNHWLRHDSKFRRVNHFHLWRRSLKIHFCKTAQ